MDTVVHFDNVTKRYGSAVAVDALDLRIEAGKFVTLLGPSGCGKSTTLRLLGGFETPDSGRVMLAGRDVTHLPPNRRDVNIVFQDYALFPHMNVARNIAFGPELQGKSQREIEVRVAELLHLVQLEDYADRMPAQLSGGQRQRIALMRALAPDPRMLLLDEPLSALDAKLRQQMQIELKSIQERTGKTFLFVTHDQEEALTMSDVIVVMNEGRIEQIGEPKTLYNAPGQPLRRQLHRRHQPHRLHRRRGRRRRHPRLGRRPGPRRPRPAPAARRTGHRRRPPRGTPALARRGARPDPGPHPPPHLQGHAHLARDRPRRRPHPRGAGPFRRDRRPCRGHGLGRLAGRDRHRAAQLGGAAP